MAGDGAGDRLLLGYARYLGIEPHAEPGLLSVARAALTEPLPHGWERHVHAEYGMPYFFHEAVGTTWEHPLLAHYLARIDALRKGLDAESRPPGPTVPPLALGAQPADMHPWGPRHLASMACSNIAGAPSSVSGGATSTYASVAQSSAAHAFDSPASTLNYNQQLAAQQPLLYPSRSSTWSSPVQPAQLHASLSVPQSSMVGGLTPVLPLAQQMISEHQWRLERDLYLLQQQHMRQQEQFELHLQLQQRQEQLMRLGYADGASRLATSLFPSAMGFPMGERQLSRPTTHQSYAIMSNSVMAQSASASLGGLLPSSSTPAITMGGHVDLISTHETAPEIAMGLNSPSSAAMVSRGAMHSPSSPTIPGSMGGNVQSSPNLSVAEDVQSLSKSPIGLSSCVQSPTTPVVKIGGVAHASPTPAITLGSSVHSQSTPMISIGGTEARAHFPCARSGPLRIPRPPVAPLELSDTQLGSYTPKKHQPSPLNSPYSAAGEASSEFSPTPRSEQDIAEWSDVASPKRPPPAQYSSRVPLGLPSQAFDVGGGRRERRKQRATRLEYMEYLQNEATQHRQTPSQSGHRVQSERSEREREHTSEREREHDHHRHRHRHRHHRHHEREDEVGERLPNLKVEPSMLFRRRDLEGGEEAHSGVEESSDEDELPSLRDLVAVIRGVGSALRRTGKVVGSSEVLAKAISTASAATGSARSTALAALRRAAGYSEILPSVVMPPAQPMDVGPATGADWQRRHETVSAPPPPTGCDTPPSEAVLSEAVVALRLFCEQSTRGYEELRPSLTGSSRAMLEAAITSARQRVLCCTTNMSSPKARLADSFVSNACEMAALAESAAEILVSSSVEAGGALQGLEARVGTLRELALNQLHMPERAPSAELTAAEHALQKLDSAAAFELEQVLWRGGLRGAALQARVASELNELRSEWLSYKTLLEARAVAEEERDAHERQQRASFCVQDINNAAAHMLARLQPHVVEALTQIAVVTVRALLRAIESLHNQLPKLEPTRLLGVIASCAESLSEQLASTLRALEGPFLSCCSGAVKLAAEVAQEVALASSLASDDERVATSVKMLDQRRLMFLHDLEQGKERALTSLRTEAHFALRLGEAVAAKALLASPKAPATGHDLSRRGAYVCASPCVPVAFSELSATIGRTKDVAPTRPMAKHMLPSPSSLPAAPHGLCPTMDVLKPREAESTGENLAESTSRDLTESTGRDLTDSPASTSPMNEVEATPQPSTSTCAVEVVCVEIAADFAEEHAVRQDELADRHLALVEIDEAATQPSFDGQPQELGPAERAAQAGAKANTCASSIDQSSDPSSTTHQGRSLGLGLSDAIDGVAFESGHAAISGNAADVDVGDGIALAPGDATVASSAAAGSNAGDGDASALGDASIHCTAAVEGDAADGDASALGDATICRSAAAGSHAADANGVIGGVAAAVEAVSHCSHGGVSVAVAGHGVDTESELVDGEPLECHSFSDGEGGLEAPSSRTVADESESASKRCGDTVVDSDRRTESGTIAADVIYLTDSSSPVCINTRSLVNSHTGSVGNSFSRVGSLASLQSSMELDCCVQLTSDEHESSLLGPSDTPQAAAPSPTWPNDADERKQEAVEDMLAFIDQLYSMGGAPSTA